ncbi:MAG: regulatory iron-sulfur-containing complex subunit RicT, partial [Phycisphaerales bacterium]
MPIHPLPQFEADVKAALAEEDRKVYEALRAPKTLVVRFGAMNLVGEFPYSGEIKPGCGSKMVVRTFRGVELGEMLTSTCPNSGCSKSVSRKEMLSYIDNSGGRDYPFFTDGRVLRVATKEDLDRQAAIEQSKHGIRAQVRDIAARIGFTARIVDVEPILGGESLTIYCLSEERVELRDLVREASREFRAHVEVRQVGARDEARLTADYEKCGQYCCCKNFLKVLRPISMKSAKVQKATLDPLKISGRCGRLMCCLRYEDATYEELRKKLPRKKSRVGTPEGDGIVIDGQILTQLALVELDALGTDGRPRRVAVPIEELTAPGAAVAPPRPESEARGMRDRGPGRRPGPPQPGPKAAPEPGAMRPPREPGPPREQSQRREQPPPREDRPPRQPGPAPRKSGGGSVPPKTRDEEIDELLEGLDDDAGAPSQAQQPGGEPGAQSGGHPGGRPGGRRRRRRGR